MAISTVLRNLFYKHTDELYESRDMFCQSVFQQIYNKYQLIMSNRLKFVMDEETGYYREVDPRTNVPAGKLLAPDIPYKNEIVFLGVQEIPIIESDEEFTVEMAAYMMQEYYNHIGAWNLDYYTENNLIYMYMTYAADYAVEFETRTTYKIRNCHDGSLLTYNQSVFEIEDQLDWLKAENPNVKLDYVNVQRWLAIITPDKEILPYTPKMFKIYGNVYVGTMDAGRVIYNPGVWFSNKGIFTYDSKYISENMFKIITQQAGGMTTNEHISSTGRAQKLQAQQREDSYNWGFASD